MLDEPIFSGKWQRGPYKSTKVAALDAYLGGAAVDKRLFFSLVYCSLFTAAIAAAVDKPLRYRSLPW